MPSLQARLVNLALPLLGIKSFFSEPELVDQRLAKARRKKPERPKAKWRNRLEISENDSLGYDVVTIRSPQAGRADAPHLFYLHGGGYVLDVAGVHWDTVCRLCEMLGASATVPVYPLAPEHKAPEILASMRALYGELAEQHGAQNITVMGDSAGGGMSLVLAQMLKADGGAMPGRLVLWSPWLDATATADGQAQIEPKDRMLAQIGLKTCARLYGGDMAPDDPRLSPLFGDLSDLPPIAIFSGSSDILLVDGRRLAAKLGELGKTDFEYHEYDGMFHVWMLLPVPEGKKALAQTAEFISSGAIRA
ncbi:alpha/beta hydrolase [Parerythrobacter jejuensis]|uniref:Alpha/beta hydrolase fold domain-containing protein n=1 Tax=Parerythrobacter jejuensis TaxID=795812 RepID=A0A845AJ82_9SPHN|nr:alpha/beta hydrolase [Parerythrobacter jejuensis]MXP30320.1 alpha/beta hydrolase fold domain-containing protein [Parerythrobacter jejuensis]MXP33080.1 alpha/beta hydrolase fold domain-containing protein [Parerythrobacter jejuensis]